MRASASLVSHDNCPSRPSAHRRSLPPRVRTGLDGRGRGRAGGCHPAERPPPRSPGHVESAFRCPQTAHPPVVPLRGQVNESTTRMKPPYHLARYELLPCRLRLVVRVRLVVAREPAASVYSPSRDDGLRGHSPVRVIDHVPVDLVYPTPWIHLGLGNQLGQGYPLPTALPSEHPTSQRLPGPQGRCYAAPKAPNEVPSQLATRDPPEWPGIPLPRIRAAPERSPGRDRGPPRVHSPPRHRAPRRHDGDWRPARSQRRVSR